MTTITGQNWREHCTEPPLTIAEIVRLRAMSAAFRADDDLVAPIHAATEALWDKLQAAETTVTEDWSGFVAGADALRRLQRAEVEAWEGMNTRLLKEIKE